jgi:hypothetical protein
MTPRALDWRSVRPKLRKIGKLLDTLRGFVALDGESSPSSSSCPSR